MNISTLFEEKMTVNHAHLNIQVATYFSFETYMAFNRKLFRPTLNKFDILHIESGMSKLLIINLLLH